MPPRGTRAEPALAGRRRRLRNLSRGLLVTVVVSELACLAIVLVLVLK